jgi:ribosomal protein L12E/L44/L45/RPP1/RPP2
MIAESSAGDRLVMVASVVEKEVAEGLEKRQRGRGSTGGGAGGGVERERKEASERTEEAKEANEEKEQEVKGQWRSGGVAVVL